MIRITLAMALALTGFGVLSGCQASGHGHENSADMAVMCDKCKTTWVQKAHQNGRMTTYSTAKVMVCPDCKSAVETYFSTGKFEHSCKTCGDSMHMCEVH